MNIRPKTSHGLFAWPVVFTMVGGILLVFGLVLFQVTKSLRTDIRRQIISRDANLLHSASMMQEQDEDFSLADPSEQFAVVLKASRLPLLQGVIMTRLFDPQGRFITSIPLDVSETTIPQSELDQLNQLKPRSFFYEEVNLTDFSTLPSTAFTGQRQKLSILEIVVPLHYRDKSELLGIAQFILDGQLIASRFSELDRRLWMQAGIAYVIGSGGIIGILLWALTQLKKAHLALLERTNNLAAANQQLTLMAKTSAVGAVTAHLLHDLKNPLSGLKTWVSTQNARPATASSEEWQDVTASMHKMHTMVHDVLRMLGEDESSAKYEISFRELAEQLQHRLQDIARARQAEVKINVQVEGALGNKQANLLLLILQNLLANGLEASAPGQSVELQICSRQSVIRCRIQDHGAGLPGNVRTRLFQGLRSTKPGGTGLGLALSKQLALHLGANLELESTSESGTVFILELPATILGQTPENK